MSKGDIDTKLSHMISSLAKIGAEIEPETEELPTIVLESSRK